MWIIISKATKVPARSGRRGEDGSLFFVQPCTIIRQLDIIATSSKERERYETADHHSSLRKLRLARGRVTGHGYRGVLEAEGRFGLRGQELQGLQPRHGSRDGAAVADREFQ